MEHGPYKLLAPKGLNPRTGGSIPQKTKALANPKDFSLHVSIDIN